MDAIYRDAMPDIFAVLMPVADATRGATLLVVTLATAIVAVWMVILAPTNRSTLNLLEI